MLRRYRFTRRPGGTEPASLPDNVTDRRGRGASEQAEDSFPLTAREEPADHRLDLPPREVRQVHFGDRRRRRSARRAAVHLGDERVLQVRCTVAAPRDDVARPGKAKQIVLAGVQVLGDRGALARGHAFTPPRLSSSAARNAGKRRVRSRRSAAQRTARSVSSSTQQATSRAACP